AVKRDVRVVELGVERPHREPRGQARRGRRALQLAHELMTVHTRHLVTALLQRREQLAVVVPCRDRYRGLAVLPSARFRAIEEREVLSQRRTGGLDHHVASVVDAETGDRIAVHPAEHGERCAPAQPAQQPLQSSWMKEGMWIGSRVGVADHREQRRQVALHVETAFPYAGHRATIVDRWMSRWTVRRARRRTRNRSRRRSAPKRATSTDGRTDRPTATSSTRTRSTSSSIARRARSISCLLTAGR